jgi:hypothetical protein
MIIDLLLEFFVVIASIIGWGIVVYFACTIDQWRQKSLKCSEHHNVS